MRATFLHVLRCLLLVFLVMTGVHAAFGQSERGAIAGDVTDQSGAVVPNAVITATNQATGGKSTAKSTSAGSYRFPDLPVGSYTVTVSSGGFSTATSTGVLVTVNSTTSLAVKLQPGAVNETVTVDASGLRLETESSDISGTISSKQITDLPLSIATGVGGLRSPETFVFLVPGTTGPGSGGTAPFMGNGVFLSRLSGGQAYGAEVLLDGASIQRSENGSSFDETSPSIEVLQEFKVTTSTPSAEFGRTTAGIESFVTKSGANTFHGSAFAIIKNRVFDANNWFNNGYAAINCKGVPEINCSYKRPQDSKYDFGGVLSGPVTIPHLYNGRDRSFFTFAWEQYKLHLGGVTQATVPTQAERNGDFSAILGSATSVINPCTGLRVLQNQIFDPATTNSNVTATNPTGVPCRLPFAGNIVPQSRFSVAAKNLLVGLPLPNQTATLNAPYGFFNNYAQSSVAPTYNTTYTIRVDQNISDKSKLFASYSSRDNFSLHGYPNLPEPFNNTAYTQDFETHYGRLGWDYTLTPTLLNHVNLGYNRTNSNNISQSFAEGRSATAAGIPNEHSTAFPVIGWDGLDSFSPWGQQQNGQNIDNGIRVNEIVSWQKGRHSFRFGVDWRHQQYSTIQYNSNYINFLRSETDVAAIGATPQFQSGNSFASFLLGQVDNAGQTVYNHAPQWNSQYFAGFVQDDLKLTSSLTVNIGLRYDVDLPRHEKTNSTSAFSFTAPDAKAGNLPGALVFGANCNCNTAWADTWYKDIAPRIGFAYVLPNTNNKAVLRGGGAIIYGPLQYNDFGSSMTAGYTIGRSIGSFYTGPGTAAGFSPAFQLDSGYPSTSFTPNLDPTQLTQINGPGDFDAVAGEVITAKEGRPSMTSNWSLQLQDQLAQDLIFTIGYIGQEAQNLRSGYLSNINNIDPKYFSYGDHLNDRYDIIPLGGTNGLGFKAPYSNFTGNMGQSLRPFPQYDYIAGDCCLENLGHSSYHALVVSLNRRFRNGFNLQASYTWSKTLTNSDSAIPFSYEPQLTQSQNSNDPHQSKSVSFQNIPHQFSLSYLYQLPFGKGRKYLNSNRGLDYLVGGWEIGAIQRYQSGQPIPFGCATGIAYYQNCIKFDHGPAAYNGPASDAFRANKNGPNVFNGQSWFKPAYRPAGTNGASDPGVSMANAAFIDRNREGVGWLRPASATCPDGCSYNPFVFATNPYARVTSEITGPLYLAEDLSVIKNFAITEKVSFQFKAEAFDLLNRHRMALPDLQPGDSTGTLGFGIPGGVDYGPRNMQVQGRVTF